MKPLSRSGRARRVGAGVAVSLLLAGCAVTEESEADEPGTGDGATAPVSPTTTDDGLPSGVKIITDLPAAMEITKGTLKPLDPPDPDDVNCGAYTLDPVEFEVDQWELGDGGRALLDELAAWLLDQTAPWTAEVRGHTDVRSSALPGGNEELSRLRAAAVVDHLVAAGVERSRLASTGLGASVLVDAGTDDAAHARNRRVEFVMQCDS